MSFDPRTDIPIGSDFPGTWTDANGALHFDVPEIHKFLGIVDDSEESRRETVAMLTWLLAEQFPEAKVIPRYDPPQPPTPQ